MIGQHIYSRCLEGYFSKSGLNADSTTVTISVDMFAREEQARRIARECERVSTLEDVRSVPEKVQGAYRGVLKIWRLNKQLTVVCRSYRLHSEQGRNGGGESRDFTFSSSYILSGEDRDRFLQHPEYCLNIQDFEAYPSVMQRIEASRAQGRSGRIEANKNYSLFRNACRDANFKVFEQAGFTRKLFVEYISSIIQRVSYSHYSGHERDKVLIILPQKYNMPWEQCGGNKYAEEVLAATLKILPECVRGQLNATTGGMREPDAYVLEGYQLVFMEPGSTKEWRKSEYSVIDLDRQESFVTENLDTSYGEFLWENLFEDNIRKNFEKQYGDFFGAEKVFLEDNSPEKFSLVLHLLQEEKNAFQNEWKRRRLMVDLIDYCGEEWTKRAGNVLLQTLKQELMDFVYHEVQEEVFLELVQKESCPVEFKEPITIYLRESIACGEAKNPSVNWFYEKIKNQDALVMKMVTELNSDVSLNTYKQWYNKKSLLQLYLKICSDSEIYADTRIKREVLEILAGWYQELLKKSDWEYCIKIIKIRAELLDDARLNPDDRRSIYQDLMHLLFAGEGENRKQIADLLKKEERKIVSEPQNTELLWKCFEKEMQETTQVTNEDVIWQMTYMAVSQDEAFLQCAWEPLYADFFEKYGRNSEVLKKLREYFISWTRNIQDEKKLQLVYKAILITELYIVESGIPECLPEMNEFRKTQKLLKKNGLNREAGEIVYRRYLGEGDPAKREFFYRNTLNNRERWEAFLYWLLEKPEDSVLEKLRKEMGEDRKEFLGVIDDFQWRDKDEVKKAAQAYFSFMRYDISRQNYSDADIMRGWCKIFRNEIKDIAESKTAHLKKYINVFFKKVMKEQNPVSGYNLDMEDVLFLENSGMLPTQKGWEYLKVLADLYMVDSQCVSEEFMLLRERMTKGDKQLKRVYLDALESKRDFLLQNGEEGELIYNIALLEEQIRQELWKDEEFDLERVVQSIFRNGGSTERLMTALFMIYVIQSYGHGYSHDIYDCTDIRNQLFKEVLLTAKNTPDLYASRKIVKAYKMLSREAQAVLEKNGFKHYINVLPDEWKNAYGIGKEKNRQGVLISVILASIFTLLGAGVELFFFFFAEHIGMNIAIITALILVAVGVLGDVIVVIWMLVSGRKTRSSAKMRRE